MGIYGIFLDRQIAPDRTGQELDGWSLWPAYVRPEQQPHAQHFEIRSFRKTEAVLMKWNGVLAKRGLDKSQA